jgi:hypothetical protein
MFDGKRTLFCNTKTSNENIYCDANGKIPHETLLLYPNIILIIYVCCIMRFDVTAVDVDHCNGLSCDTMLLGRYHHGELVATILGAEVPHVLCITMAATVLEGYFVS